MVYTLIVGCFCPKPLPLACFLTTGVKRRPRVRACARSPSVHYVRIHARDEVWRRYFCPFGARRSQSTRGTEERDASVIFHYPRVPLGTKSTPRTDLALRRDRFGELSDRHHVVYTCTPSYGDACGISCIYHYTLCAPCSTPANRHSSLLFGLCTCSCSCSSRARGPADSEIVVSRTKQIKKMGATCFVPMPSEEVRRKLWCRSGCSGGVTFTGSLEQATTMHCLYV